VLKDILEHCLVTGTNLTKNPHLSRLEWLSQSHGELVTILAEKSVQTAVFLYPKRKAPERLTASLPCGATVSLHYHAHGMQPPCRATTKKP